MLVVRRVVLLALLGVGACDCGGNTRTGQDAGPNGPPAPPPGAPTGMFFDLEFDRDAQGNATEAYVRTISGARAVLTFTPMPSHAFVHTGSPGLENKANLGAYPLIPAAELAESGGNGNGLCDSNEVCTNTTEQAVANRIPLRVPVAMRVNAVSLDFVLDLATDFTYVGSDKHWGVRLEVGEHTVLAGHLGWIAPDLRSAILAAGGPDTDTYNGPLGANLVPDGAQLILPAGTVFAYPQTSRLAFERTNGHIIGFHQIEYLLGRKAPPAYPGDVFPRDESPYLHYSAAERADLLSVMHHHMRTQTGIYAERASDRWLHLAEAVLEPQSGAAYEDPSTVFGRYGEWYENEESRGVCNRPAPSCDDALFFWKMVRDTPVFDASLYDRPGVTTLMVLSEKRPAPDNQYFIGEVVDPLVVDGVAADVVVKWRMRAIETLSPVYQALRFRLAGQVLTVSKGARWPSEAEASAERMALPDPATAQCNGTTVVCLTRNFTGGMPGGN
jgi:hypothetical protein